MSSNPPEITEAEIERILNMPPDQYPVEQAMAPEDSPLNDPVEEKEFPDPPQEQVQAVPKPQAQTEPISAPKLEVLAPSLATQDEATEKLPEAPQEPQLPIAVEKTITNTETTESDSPETPQTPTQNPNWKAQKKRLKKRKPEPESGGKEKNANEFPAAKKGSE